MKKKKPSDLVIADNVIHVPFGTQGASMPVKGIAEELRRTIEEAAQREGVADMVGLERLAERVMTNYSRAGIADFCGLSPDDMHCMLYAPFESPALVRFMKKPGNAGETPVMVLFNMLMEALPETGLKGTVTGNLPRNFCRDVARRFMGEARYAEFTKLGGFNSETDFIEFHVVRIIAQQAGFVENRKGKFFATSRYHEVAEQEGADAFFFYLLKACVEGFNWGYIDFRDDLPIVQDSFLFTLYLLHAHRDEPRPGRFYADAFLQAFPQAVAMVAPRPSSTAEEEVRSMYMHRAIRFFAQLFGFVRIVSPDGRPHFHTEEGIVDVLPFLSEFVHFAR